MHRADPVQQAAGIPPAEWRDLQAMQRRIAESLDSLKDTPKSSDSRTSVGPSASVSSVTVRMGAVSSPLRRYCKLSWTSSAPLYSHCRPS